MFELIGVSYLYFSCSCYHLLSYRYLLPNIVKINTLVVWFKDLYTKTVVVFNELKREKTEYIVNGSWNQMRHLQTTILRT